LIAEPREEDMSHQLISYLDEDWQRAVNNVRAAAARIWAAPAHRHAIDHGPAHADRVVALLDGLTEGLMSKGDQSLAQEEIYILIAATYLHAISLQDEKTEPDPGARWESYPELGAEMIYRAAESPEEAAELSLIDDPGLVEIVMYRLGHARGVTHLQKVDSAFRALSAGESAHLGQC
jgi:hypothetical protein